MSKIFTALAFLFAGILVSQQSTAQTQPRDTTFKRPNLGVPRFYVNSPASLVGMKKVTIATWGNSGNPPIINKQVVKGLDSLAANPLTNAAAINGKVCLLFRGGGISFAQKAQYAQNAGAIAVIIVNNIPGDPIAMGNTGTATLNIPIVMLSDVDGIAMNNVLLGAGTVYVSISDWDLGVAHDLALLKGYQSAPHSMSIPYTQLSMGANRIPYKNFVGGAVINYGTSTETGISVVDTVTWNPASGAASTVHTGSYTVPNIAPADSIRFGFGTTGWALPAATGKGYFRYKYGINFPNTDATPSDDTMSFYQYVTDSIFCKGTYDYTRNQPVATISFRPASTTVTTYSWGPMYYIADGKYYARKLQYFVGTSGTSMAGEESYGLLFKWTDGSNAQPLDSFVEGEELKLVGLARKAYTAADSTYFITTVSLATPNTNKAVVLDSNAWYWTNVQVTQAINNLFIGCDENVSYFTRSFIQEEQNSYNDMAELIYTNDYSNLTTDTNALVSLPFGGNGFFPSQTYFCNIYYVPNVALHLSKNKVGVGVEQTAGMSIGKMQVSPVPATTSISVDLKLNAASDKVSYRLLSLNGTVAYKIDHDHVTNDNFSIPCDNIPSGIYYLAAFTADGNNAVERVIIRH
jgi:hypothetical protein